MSENDLKCDPDGCAAHIKALSDEVARLRKIFGPLAEFELIGVGSVFSVKYLKGKPTLADYLRVQEEFSSKPSAALSPSKKAEPR